MRAAVHGGRQWINWWSITGRRDVEPIAGARHSNYRKRQLREDSTPMIRTRYARSQTGYMHIGNLRTALYTFLYARHNGGKMILRIEDTDTKRTVPGAVEVIYESLRLAHIEYDEGPDKDGGVGPYVQT